MKRVFLFLFLAGIGFSGFTQRVYFLYIQSELSQPFYVKLNEKIYSSASSGYLILSHLRDSTYDFSVGFPGKNVVEQRFNVKLSGKDHGYLLKNFENKGWGLFDLQTMGVMMSNSNVQTAVENKGPVKKDESAFTQILAKASDDSTLLEKPDLPKVKEEKKTEVAKQEVKSPVVNEVTNQPGLKTETVKPDLKPVVAIEAAKQPEKTSEVITEKKTEPVVDKPTENKAVEQSSVQLKEQEQGKVEEKAQVDPPVYKKSEVLRKSESSTTEGFGVTYIDEQSDGARDTIKILIPQPKAEVQVEKTEVKEEKKFLDISTDTNKQETPVSVATDPKTTKPEVAVKKNSCPSLANENDFFKLRKKMAGEAGDAAMVNEAVKIFKTKCFTTEQIKNLSTLFLKDDGKYKFFDAAYLSVSDLENFPALQNELKEEYYLNRFKAMLR